MANMKYIRIGRTGVLGSVLALGAMTFGEKNVWKLGGVDQELANKMVKRSIDAGINFFDTADVYDEGRSEVLLGRALTGYREQVLIATKVRGRTGQGVNETGLSKHHINIAIRKSLERLNTTWIDFYQFHGWDALAPLEEAAQAMQRLVEEGLVNYPGVSNFAAWQMAVLQTMVEERGYARYETAQMNYSLLNRDIEHEVLPFLDYSGMTLLVWSPLHGGILTGKYTNYEKPQPGTRMGNRGFFFPPFDPALAQQVVEKLKDIAKQQGATPAQVALAWLLTKKLIVIIGARTMEQLEENLGALDVNLKPSQVDELNELTRPKPQYPGWMIERQNKDRQVPIIE
ncbi:MAG: aldo/keto reductase [Thermocladium sp.]